MKTGSVQVVLVDNRDKVEGYNEKFAAHKIPVPLHRAISILIFNKNKTEMLITKRSRNKPVWPLYWSNAVCSHPFPGETYQHAAERRIFEELGFKTKLKSLFKFIYKADMDNGIWGEHECDSVFVGYYEGEIRPDPNEIEGYEWLSVDQLKKELEIRPEKYTPWFKIILKKGRLL